MRNARSFLIGLIVVVIVAVGAYALLHKSSTKTNTTGLATSQNTAPAVNNSILTTKTDPKLGKYLADPSGKPLYTYNADSSGVSNCTGGCLATWPAYVASTSSASLPSGVSTIKRTDNGQTQYTYNGMPLYYFVSDTNGTPTGDGVQDFKLAKPSNTSSTSGSSNTNNSSSSSSGNTNSSGSSNPYNY